VLQKILNLGLESQANDLELRDLVRILVRTDGPLQEIGREVIREVSANPSRPGPALTNMLIQ
jgi:hypothetical protein